MKNGHHSLLCRTCVQAVVVYRTLEEYGTIRVRPASNGDDDHPAKGAKYVGLAYSEVDIGQKAVELERRPRNNNSLGVLTPMLDQQGDITVKQALKTAAVLVVDGNDFEEKAAHGSKLKPDRIRRILPSFWRSYVWHHYLNRSFFRNKRTTSVQSSLQRT
jgi:hypothetical protein